MNTQKWFLIETEEEYNTAMARYQEIRKAQKGTEEHKEKLLLIHLMAEYEKIKYPLEELDPVEFILIRMEDKQLKQVDIERDFKVDSTLLSKVLNRRISMSINMIRTLSKALDIPSECLLKEYPLTKSRYNKQMA